MFPLPDLIFTGAAATDLTLELDRRLDHFGLSDLFHQIRDAPLFDKLRTDIFRKSGKFFDLIRIGEKVGQKMKAFNKTSQQIDEGLSLIKIGDLSLKTQA